MKTAYVTQWGADEVRILIRQLPIWLQPKPELTLRQIAEMCDYRIRWLTQARSPHRWITVAQMAPLRDLHIEIMNAVWAAERRVQ